MIDITVDSRYRIPLSGLEPEMADKIRARFDHRNPRAGDPRLGEPPRIQTWRDEDGCLTLPRGGAWKAADLLCKVPHRIVDARTWSHVVQPHLHCRPTRQTLDIEPFDYWPHQIPIIGASIEKEQGIIRAGTGCVDGEALVTINRAGKGGKMSIAHVVRAFNGGAVGGRRWRPDIPTMIRAPFLDGTVRLAKLLGAWNSGVRPVYEVRTTAGHVLRTTGDHPYQTLLGWMRLDSLSVGDHILVDGGFPSGGKGKSWYLLRTVREHPFASRKNLPSKRHRGGWTVPLHRLVAEARLNGLGLEDFLAAVRCRRPGLVFLDPVEFVVHHRDENPRNNDPSNLVVLTHEEHRRAHLEESIRNITAVLKEAEISSIELVGTAPTYDLEVEGCHAFLANEIAVHNSGKTSCGLGIFAQLQHRTLVMVWSGPLLKQWIERACDELARVGRGHRLSARDLGIIQGSTFEVRDLTIGMQETIVRRVRDNPELGRFFDVLFFDEVQRAPADTVYATIDPFAARYRLAASADEERKDDMQFLTYDLFGDVIAEVGQEELIATQSTVDVEFCVIPTAFRAPWYRGQPWQWKRLVDQMVNDDARNALILRLAARAVREGEQVLVFTHRVEHARQLDSQLSGLGIRSGVMLGGVENSRVFDHTRDEIRAGRCRAAVGTYQSIAQAIDLPSISRGVGTTPIANNKQTVGQVRGRLCRSHQGKQGARFAYLMDESIYGAKPVRNFLEWGHRTVVWSGGYWVPGQDWLDARKRRRRS